MRDRDLPETAPFTAPWLDGVDRLAAVARQRARQASRRAAAARAAALMLAVPPPLPVTR